MATPAPDPGALSGMRTLELGEGFALACAGSFFAALGAEVIKVEPPGRGDRLRMAGPFLDGQPDREASALFAFLNGAKRSVTLDFSSRTGRALLGRLADGCDVVLHSLQPAEAEAVFARVPHRAVLVSVTPFGAEGPYAGLPATELTLQAMMGLAYMTGEPHREPLQVGVPLASYVSGQTAFIAALAACLGSSRAGADVSMFESAAAVLEHAPMTWAYRRRVWKRRGNWSGIAGWGVYPCADGYAAVISGIGAAYARFRELVGLTDPAFAVSSARTQRASELDAAILSWLEGRTRREVFAEGQRRRLPFGYVAHPEDIMESPQLRARDFFVELESESGRRVRLPGAPYRMSECVWRWDRPPRLGEHSAEVYGALGLGGRALLTLRQQGVI
jgi:benzylsuccinate CoA-transferase BbsE subunit